MRNAGGCREHGLSTIHAFRSAADRRLHPGACSEERVQQRRQAWQLFCRKHLGAERFSIRTVAPVAGAITAVAMAGDGMPEPRCWTLSR
jgi:hypothetical protein